MFLESQTYKQLVLRTYKKLEKTELIAQILALQNTKHMFSGSRFEHQAELIQI